MDGAPGGIGWLGERTFPPIAKSDGWGTRHRGETQIPFGNDKQKGTLLTEGDA